MEIRYDRYRFTPVDAVIVLIPGSILFACLDCLLYRSLYLAAGLPLFWAFGFFLVKRARIRQRRRQLREAFLPGIRSFVVALRAGYSPENALPEVMADLSVRYPKHHPLLMELGYIRKQCLLSVPLSGLFEDLARRSRVPEICDFAAVFAIGSRTGGGMVELLWSCGEHLEKRLELEKELEASLAARRMEQRIMNLVPAAMLLYLELSGPSYTAVYFSTLAGRIVMTFCVGLFAAAWWWGERIGDIHV